MKSLIVALIPLSGVAAGTTCNPLVLPNYPVVVTECDWSPEKPGQGRLNEFGDYVPANHGTWGTATTSRWGKALRYAVEKLGNVSMMVGGMDNVLDVDHYLKTAEVRTPKAFKNDLESVGPYVFHCWFRDWAREKPQTPGYPNHGGD